MTKTYGFSKAPIFRRLHDWSWNCWIFFPPSISSSSQIEEGVWLLFLTSCGYCNTSQWRDRYPGPLSNTYEHLGIVFHCPLIHLQYKQFLFQLQQFFISLFCYMVSERKCILSTHSPLCPNSNSKTTKLVLVPPVSASYTYSAKTTAIPAHTTACPACPPCPARLLGNLTGP